MTTKPTMEKLKGNDYQIVYADPPWTYTNKQRWVGEKYDLMTIEDLKRLPVSEIVSKDAVLCMWITFPLLTEGLAVLDSWGFKYKTNLFTWVKQNKRTPSLFWGMGYYSRSNAEICILAKRGKGLKRQSASVHSVILEPVGQHSKKPTTARQRIEQLFVGDQEVKRIELFAREATPHWDAWGDEAPIMSEEGTTDE